MSTNSSDLGRPRNPTHFGGEGLYDASSVEDAGPLKVRLGDQMDGATRRSLLAEGPANSARSFIKRYPVATALALGSIGWLLVSLTRRSLQR